MKKTFTILLLIGLLAITSSCHRKCPAYSNWKIKNLFVYLSHESKK